MNETKVLSFHWFGFFIVIGNWFIAKEMTIFGSIYLYRKNKILQQTIQYPMLEFEPTTSSTQVVSRNH